MLIIWLPFQFFFPILSYLRFIFDPIERNELDIWVSHFFLQSITVWTSARRAFFPVCVCECFIFFRFFIVSAIYCKQNVTYRIAYMHFGCISVLDLEQFFMHNVEQSKVYRNAP